MVAETKKKILVISSCKKKLDIIENLENCIIDRVEDVSNVNNLFKNNSYDAIVIDYPLKTEDGVASAIEFTNSTNVGIMILTNSTMAKKIYPIAEHFGFFCVEKTAKLDFFRQAINLVFTMSKRLKHYAKKNEHLEEKVEEIKLISRAKLLLVTKLAFTEEEAHRYIEKQAMNRCVKKVVIAYDIINNYNN